MKRRVSSTVRPSVRSFIRSSLFPLCLSGASIYYGGTNRDASYKFKGEIKIRDQPIKCQLIIRKIIKIIATRCHMLTLNCTKFYSRRLSVRPSVRPSVRLLDGVWHLPRIVSLLNAEYWKALRYAALGMGCTLTAVPSSTQPSTLRGTVNGWLLIKLALDECSVYSSLQVDSEVKFAAWLTGWRPLGADPLSPRWPKVNSRIWLAP